MTMNSGVGAQATYGDPQVGKERSNPVSDFAFSED